MTVTNGEFTGDLVRGATDAAKYGPEHVTEPTAYDAILLASFGGPEGQDDVIPFLRNVTRGRGIPDARLEEVAHHYRAFDGISPINQQNRELKAALEAELERRGIDLPVLWGNRNWAPFIRDAVSEANERGFTKLIAIGTSAYSSYSGCRQYREDYAAALTDTGLDGVIQIDKIRQFFDHPGFVTPFIEGLRTGLAEVAAAGIPLSETHVLFSTRSRRRMPRRAARRSATSARVAPMPPSTGQWRPSWWRVSTCGGAWCSSREVDRPPSRGSSPISTMPFENSPVAASARWSSCPSASSATIWK
jgi:ferrochelatase